VTPYEFVISIFGVVVALSISRLLAGAANLIRNWKFTDVHVFYVFWIALLLVMQIGWWFSIWRTEQDVAISFLEFLWNFQAPAFLYIATHILIPADSDEDSFQTRYTYYKPAFLLVALPLIAMPTLGILFSQQYYLLFLTAIAVLLISGTVVSHIRYHQVIIALATILYTIFIVMYRSGVGGANLQV
jgi:hypothetical protein